MDVPYPYNVSYGGHTGEIQGLCNDKSHSSNRRGLPGIDHKRGPSGLERIVVGRVAGAFHGSHGLYLVYEDEEDLCGCDLGVTREG